MTREEAIFKAMSAANDTYLAQTEADAPRLTRTAKRRWIPAVAAAMLILTVGSVAALSGLWDSLFLERLHPNEGVMRKSESMVQDVQSYADYGDVKITLTQTLGDALNLYLAIDVRFSEELDLSSYLTNADSEILFSPHTMRLYKDDGTQYGKELNRPFTSRGQYGSCVYDPETNSVRFLASFTDDNAEFTKYDGIILVIDSICGTVADTGEEILLEGPFQVSWKAENTGPVYEFDLMSDGEKIGQVYLSSLSLSVSILARELDGEDVMEKLDTLRASSQILMKDGSEFPLHARTGSGGSMIRQSTWFDSVLDLEQVERVCVAGYTLTLE